MKRTGKWMVLAVAVVLLLILVCVPVMAAEPAADGAVEETAANDGGISGKAMAAAIAIGLAATAGAVAMGIVITKAVDGISRQPEADGKIRTTLMLGLVFIETVVIYALFVSILVIFVL